MDERVTLLKALAHPLRLRVVDRLGHRGPAPVSQLAVELDATLPDLSNGLRQLREAGIVVAVRKGRQMVYELADDRLPALLDKLVAMPPAHPASTPADAVLPPAASLSPGNVVAPAGSGPSRTCYDHLAGPLGVALYRALLARGALLPAADGTVSIGDPSPLRALGIGEIDPGRRRLAFECLDATEHALHLAGSLGDAVAGALLDRGWVARGEGRLVHVTLRGTRGLRTTLRIITT